jgi:hypothetical protein
MNYQIRICSCGCGNQYPIGKAKPAGWKQINKKSIKRLSDGVVFSVGDIIQRFTEQSKQYCDMVIENIDFYYEDNKAMLHNTFYIRASVIKTSDNSIGSTNITDTITDYTSADNPNTFRFIKKLNN